MSLLFFVSFLVPWQGQACALPKEGLAGSLVCAQRAAVGPGYGWKLVVGCAHLGVSHFREQFELSSFLAWSHLRGLHCGLIPLRLLMASKAVAPHSHCLLPAALTPPPCLSIPGLDTMSETSSISVEATTDSRDTSVATSILLPLAGSRGREEADTRSEHSYSESGASGSSFEELDLEVAGDGEGAPGLLPDGGYTGNQEVTDKWTKEPIAAERGEE